MNVEKTESCFALLTQSKHHLDTGDYALAEEIVQKIFLEIDLHNQKKEYGIEEKKILAKTMRILGLIQSKQGKNSEALTSLGKSLELAVEIQDSVLEMQNYGGMANVYFHQSEYQTAIELNKKAHATAVKIGDEKSAAVWNGNLAAIYMAYSDYDTALRYYENTLKIAEKYHNRRSEAMVLGNIGIIYFHLLEFNRANDCFLQALSISKELSDKSEAARHLGNLGNVHTKLLDYSRALEYYKQAKIIADEINNAAVSRRVYGNIGTVYFYTKEYNSALDYFDKALELSKKYNFERGIGLQYGNLGRLYATLEWEQCNSEKGLEFLQTALNIFEKLGANEEFAETHLYLAEVYERQGQWEQFAFHLREHHRIEKQTVSEQAKKRLEYTTIQLLEREKELLSAKNAQLQELLHNQNEILGIASHDLKNPLHSIQLTVQYLLNYFPTADIERKELYSDILDSANRMSGIIANLLDTHAIEQGKIFVLKESVNISAMLSDLSKEYKQRTLAKNILLSISAAEPVCAMADRRYLHQVMDNLLSNAIKFSLSGTNIAIAATMSGDAVRISVRDQGPGLTDADKLKLFGKFARLSARPTAGEDSTGLGLSITKKLTEMMGGAIWCESEPGHGAEFIVEFPTAPIKEIVL